MSAGRRAENNELLEPTTTKPSSGGSTPTLEDSLERMDLRLELDGTGGRVRRQSSEWTVRMLADLRGRINTEAEYQRGKVWSDPQQLLLIDSILREYDLPKIFLRKLPPGSSHLFDVVDGKQRLTAIWRFLGDEIRLPRSYSYPGLGAVGGKTWSEFPQDAKDRLEFAKVTVSELEDYDDEAIRELFQRLQKGEPLNSAERRNAMGTPVRDFVANVLAQHPLWPETGFQNKRFAWDEMSALVLALVRAEGPAALKGADLISMYEDPAFDSDGDVAKQTIAWLDSLRAVAAVDRGIIRTRWGLVDLLLALMRVGHEGLAPPPDQVMDFFKQFESERREGTIELSDLRSSVMELAAEELETEQLELPSIKPDMLSYISAFSREGATKENVRARAEVMTSRMRQYLKAN